MKKFSLLAIIAASLMIFGCKKDEPKGPDPRPFILEILKLADDNGQNMKICTDGTCSDETRILIENLSLTNYPTTSSGRFVLQYDDNGTTKYIGIEKADWLDFQQAYAGVTDPTAKELLITQFFQANFDTFGNLTPPDPFTTDLNDPHYFTDKNGAAFSEASDSIKDVDLIGANIENVRAEKLEEALSATYGLSTERAQVVAKNISAYQKLTSKRSLTEKEKNFFSTEVLGVSFKDAQNALTSGNSEDLNKLLENAALKNGTSPEQVSAILNEIFL
jgi:hypothetical protein